MNRSSNLKNEEDGLYVDGNGTEDWNYSQQARSGSFFGRHVGPRCDRRLEAGAGFRAGDIGVCTSRESRNAPLAADPAGKHSLRWRLRHSAEHDSTSSGPGLTSEPAKNAASQEDAPYTELDLASAMRSMGLGPDTIQLVDREIGPDGLLIFVSAGERSREVESILEKNRGILRTSMATQ